MNRNEVIKMINSNIYYLKDASETMYNGKTFAIVNESRIKKFIKTKRGAEGYIKRNENFSYYDDYSQEMVSPNANDTIVEILSSELTDIKTNKRLWHDYLRANMSRIMVYHMGKNILCTAENSGVEVELLQYIENTIKEIEKTNGMTLIPEFVEDENIIEITSKELKQEDSEQVTVAPIEQEQAENTSIKTDYEKYKCVWGYCTAYKKGDNCKKCSELNKSKGYTGCVFATTIEDIKNLEQKQASKNVILPSEVTERQESQVQTEEEISQEELKQVTQDIKKVSEYFTITKKQHEKKHIDIWVCRLNNKISKTNFAILRENIIKLGGYYSSFKTVNGFVFREEPSELLNNSDIDIQVLNNSAIEQQPTSNNDKNIIQANYPEININDIESYVIDKKLSDRENSVSMFRRNDTDHTKVIQEILQGFNDRIVEALQGNTNTYIEYKAKEGLQRFKKKYYDIYVKMLNHRANNPSWCITGRSGLNVSRYNKKASQYEKMLGESVKIGDSFNDFVSKIKSMIREEKQKQVKQKVEQGLQNISDIDVQLVKVEKEYQVGASVNIFSNPNRTAKMYSYNDKYFIFKNWGYWRIYNSQGNEIEVLTRAMKSLGEAKTCLLYILQHEDIEQEQQAI